MIGREDEVKNLRDRGRLFSYICFFFLALIGSRLFFLQIVEGDELRRYSERNRLKKEKIFPTRGVIYDRDGRVIVDSRPSFDVVLLSQYYPFKEPYNSRLAEIVGLDDKEMKKRLAKIRRAPKFLPMLLKSDVSKDVIAEIEMDPDGFPGVDIEASVVRRYPEGDIGAQIWGYVGEANKREIAKSKQLELGDYVGKVGMERRYDKEIRGKAGAGYVEVDARGRRRNYEKGDELLGFVTRTEPEAGNDLHLTLDIDLQRVADEALKSREYSGSIVALDPRSGEILAMVSNPSFNPADLSGREVSSSTWRELSQNKERPLRNRAIQDHYPPGSIFKLIVAIASLAEGVASPSSKVKCHGSMKFGRRRFHCWKRGGHGEIDFIGAIRESCNIFFYKMGLELGVDRIAQYAKYFGFADRTEIALDSEVPGIIPTKAWKEKRFGSPWQQGETLPVAIGQGYVTATPIQLASAFAAIANEGFVYRPYILNKIVGNDGHIVKEYKPELKEKIHVPSEVYDIVKEGLWQVSNVRGGTAFWFRSRKVEISGKTGTSQVRRFKNIANVKCEELPLKQRQHGLFVGYAPRENPQIAVAAVGEHSCHGTSAAPMVKEVVDAYFDKLEKKEQQEPPAVVEGPPTREQLGRGIAGGQ